MPDRRTFEQAISDESVAQRTGRGWEEWFRILDDRGARVLSHGAAARHLADEHGVSAWWSHTITVRYEQERGLRSRGQRSDRLFEVSVRRTIDAAPEAAYMALTEPEHLNRWFTTGAEATLVVGGQYRNSDCDRGEFLVLEPPRCVRFTWDSDQHAPGTIVELILAPRPGGKVLVQVNHSRIRTESEYLDMKPGWQWAMDSLKSYLETGVGIPEP